MNKLLFIINKHDAVGRTSCAKIIEGYLARKGIESVSVHTSDGDGAGDSTLWELDDEIDMEPLFEIADPTAVTVVDVAARHAEELGDYFANSDVYDRLAELESELTVVLPVCAEIAMGDEIVRIAEQYSDEASYVIVHSTTRCEESDADHWSGSYAEKVMSYLGATEIEMPEFKADILSRIEDEQGMNVPEALVARKGLPRFLRDEVHRWELEFADKLSTATDLLIPGETHTKSVY